MSNKLTKPFLLILVLLVIVACVFLFRPFLTEIFVAAVLASIFYAPYEGLTHHLKGRKNLAALIMCFILLLVIVVPTVKIMIYAGAKSIDAYSEAVNFFNHHSLGDVFKNPFFQNTLLKNVNLERYDNDTFKSIALDVVKNSSSWLISGATTILEKTSSFLVSLVLIIITMFFFFVDGKKILEKVMYWSPLPNKYDLEIFRKFRAVSYTTFVSTFVAALAQGIAGAIGFAIVGFPFLLAGVLIALLSLLPYLGSMIFYVPMGLYYLLIGNIWQGIFILLWYYYLRFLGSSLRTLNYCDCGDYFSYLRIRVP
ncbi:MAG: AI-2E family transporter [Candidatus Falkowbacteria bacterium]|nr:AI-2E family transporter [Candidatus Falkowbacteria bacterium]